MCSAVDTKLAVSCSASWEDMQDIRKILLSGYPYFTSLAAISKYAVASEKGARCWYAPRCCNAVGYADHREETMRSDASLFSSLQCIRPEPKGHSKNPASAPCIRD